MTGATVMTSHRLVAMANQIADNVPSRDGVAEQVAHHIKQFWTPPMRRELQALTQSEPELFDAAVLDAVALAPV